MKLTSGRGADVVITATSAPENQADAIRAAARRGRISLFGSLPFGDPFTTIDANLVHYRELTIVGANSSAPAQNAAALERIRSGQMIVADLVTHTFDIPQFTVALDTVEGGLGLKVAVVPL